MAEKAWATPLPEVKSKADLVYDNLRAAISTGDLRPGERLNMDELARDFGVSKIPVREAVKRLESDGLVVSRVHAGVVVTDIDRTEMRGVFLAREAIEGLVVRLVAEQADQDVLRRLEEVQADMRADLAAGRVDRMPELNTQFHRILADASGYQVLGDLTEQLLMTVRRYRVVTPVEEAKWRSVVEEHDEVLAALRTGDPAAAAEAARSHIRSQSDSERP